jgi:hypothetical protein
MAPFTTHTSLIASPGRLFGPANCFSGLLAEDLLVFGSVRAGHREDLAGEDRQGPSWVRISSIMEQAYFTKARHPPGLRRFRDCGGPESSRVIDCGRCRC